MHLIPFLFAKSIVSTPSEAVPEAQPRIEARFKSRGTVGSQSKHLYREACVEVVLTRVERRVVECDTEKQEGAVDRESGKQTLVRLRVRCRAHDDLRATQFPELLDEVDLRAVEVLSRTEAQRELALRLARGDRDGVEAHSARELESKVAKTSIRYVRNGSMQGRDCSMLTQYPGQRQARVRARSCCEARLENVVSQGNRVHVLYMCEQLTVCGNTSA